MNVLHLTHSFLPITENWVYNQLVFNTRCTPSVLCQYPENPAQFPFGALYPRYPKKTFLSETASRFALKQGRYSKNHLRITVDIVKPDLVHGHFAYVSCCHREALAPYRLPLVTTCYGLDISKLPRLPVWQHRYAALFSSGAAFIVEGPHMAECLKKLGCPADKIHCVAIGVDLEAVRGSGAERTPGTTRVLFTGLGREKKGPLDAADAFIAVAKKHPGVRFDLIGDGKFLEPVRFLINRAGFLDKCVFHGYVSVQRYREILHSCDIVLAPSVTATDGDAEGGAPVTVIEAQAAGIPVVGTTHCDIPFVVGNGETGLLSPEKDLVKLSANLEKLVVDPDLRSKMGKAAAVRAADRHDIKKQVEKIWEVYKKCITGTESNSKS
jgi:colanic acid/amylovoran biosynthesis glycosyltransferase